MKSTIKKILIFSITIFCFLPNQSFASDIFFDAPSKTFSKGSEVKINIILNTQGEATNAVEGKIVFPRNLIDVKEIQFGDSVINFWIEKPQFVTPNTIVFSGITPNGFNGAKNNLFTLVFWVNTLGSGELSWTGVRVLRNDENATTESTSANSFSFSVGEEDKTTPISPLISEKDTTPPEDFIPTIIQNPQTFNGEKALIFSTEDKQSGMKYFQVKEGKYWWYITRESPYLLKDQSLSSEIFVKAVDNAGNERIKTISPKNNNLWYKSYTTILFILIILIFFLLVLKKGVERKKKIKEDEQVWKNS